MLAGAWEGWLSDNLYVDTPTNGSEGIAEEADNTNGAHHHHQQQQQGGSSPQASALRRRWGSDAGFAWRASKGSRAVRPWRGRVQVGGVWGGNWGEWEAVVAVLVVMIRCATSRWWW